MTDEIRACLHEIASEEAEDLYEGAEGLWARKDQIPSGRSEFSEEEYEKLLGGFSVRSAALRLLKVESGINGILPAGGGSLPFISFLS
jgi:hypothetical protein